MDGYLLQHTFLVGYSLSIVDVAVWSGLAGKRLGSICSMQLNFLVFRGKQLHIFVSASLRCRNWRYVCSGIAGSVFVELSTYC